MKQQESHRDRKKRLLSERILMEASHMFMEQGYNAVMIEDIAAACDVTKPTLYNYYPGKQAIAAGVFGQLHKDIKSRMQQDLASCKDFRDMGIAIVTCWCAIMTERRQLYLALIDAGVIGLGHNPAQNRNEQEIWDLLTEICRLSLANAPSRTSHDARELAMLMATTLFATTFHWSRNPDAYDLSALLKKHFHLILG